MTQAELHFFIDSTANYFEAVSDEMLTIGIPFIKEDENIELEYTGIIGISGKRKGNIYFTANAEMLQVLARIIIGLEQPTQIEIKDLIGEISNTISGNVREAYGSDFLISVPVVVEGEAMKIHCLNNDQAFAIPIVWKGYKSYLVVCLD